MGLLDLLIHLMSFAAPALFVALLLVLLNRVVVPNRPVVLMVWAQVAINFVAGLTVLAAGLWYFGRDGKMATYAALVVVVATSQWLLSKAWR